MKRKKFEGELLSGHKDHAVEVLFDPSREWNIQPQSSGADDAYCQSQRRLFRDCGRAEAKEILG